jgi:radical SAM superfamily enzyme YgiQ (UPF0313 family)
MKITLVNCGDPDEYAVVQYQPMAPPYIAACTPPGWDLELVDENFEPFDPHRCRADLVAFSTIPRHVDRAYAHAAVLSARGITTVAGGMHVSAIPEEALEHFDAIVEGEAEPIWASLLADVEAGTLQRHYVSGFDQPLDDLGLPDRRYIHPGYKLASVSTSRSCNNRCSFCYMGSFENKAYRTIPTDTVVEDFRQVTQKAIVLTDANFLGFTDEDVESRKVLCEALIRANLGKYWAAQITADVVRHPDLLDLLYRAGCRMAFIGFESVGRSNLGSISKEQYADLDYTDVVRTVQGKGIAVAASLILGLDTHERGYDRELMAWLDEARPLFLNLGVLTPMPNTALYHLARDEQRLLIDGIDLWRHMDKATHTLRYRNFTADEASEMFRNVVRHHFRNRNILRNFLHLFFVRRFYGLSALYVAAALKKRDRECGYVDVAAGARR